MQNEKDGAKPTTEELFPEACIPSLLEDETIYSWCARFHRLNGGCDSQATSRLLFGHPSAGLKQDMPFHMGTFHLRTQGRLGDARELLRKRTLFGFHAPFLPAETESTLLEHLLTGEGTSVSEKLGLKRAGLNMVNPLKFCPECVREQAQDNGFAWWKTSHQRPTSFLCTTHGEWLQVVAARKSRGVFQEFQVPMDGHEVISLKRRDMALHDREQLFSLGQWGSFVSGSANLRLTDATLRQCYLLQAKKRGWLTFNGTVRMQQLRDAFVAKYQGIFEYFGDGFIGELDSVNAGFLAYLLRRLPSRRHPLKHILLMNFLLDTPEELVDVLEKVQATCEYGGEGAFQKMLCDGHDHLFRLVTEDGQSVSRAAATVGVSGARAAHYLNAQGVELLDRRPHIIGTDKEQHLRQLLVQGKGRTEIAQTVGVRMAFIKDYLAAHPELKGIWRAAHRNREHQRHREQLMTAIQQHPDLPIKSIRLLPGNGFQWLYKNDRDWLIDVLPAMWKR